MNRMLLTLVVLVAGIAGACAETPAPALALKGLDPIALSQAKELTGLETLETVHGIFRYRFANAENKRLFEGDPEAHGIQFGGACGKMGPFSGMGSTERFYVHDRRIYVFASEGCREGFKKDPEKHIERPNPVPEGSADQVQRGAALVEKAIDGFGGADKVDGLKSYQEVVKHVYRRGDQETIGTHRVIWSFPDAVRIEEEFSTVYGFVVRGQSAFQLAGKQSWRIESGMRDVAWRQSLRLPLAMLQQRKQKGFVAVAGGAAMVDDTPVELLHVALHGATTTWSIDPQTGRILQIAYVARRGTVGDNRVKFGDFRLVDGLVLPHRRTAFFNGKELTSPEVRLERFVLNGEVKPEWFTQPK